MKILMGLVLLLASAGAWAGLSNSNNPLPEPGTLALLAAGAVVAFKLSGRKK